jgi:hypothetical protein
VTAFRSLCCDPAARTDEQPMSLFRTAARRDKSEKLIVETLRQLGWSVLQVSVANGPDLFAAKTVKAETVAAIGPFPYPTRFGFTYQRCVAIECKTGKRKLKPGQERFREMWAGEYVVLRSVEDVIALNGGQE